LNQEQEAEKQEQRIIPAPASYSASTVLFISVTRQASPKRVNWSMPDR
jgi:hypothetical protein